MNEKKRESERQYVEDYCIGSALVWPARLQDVRKEISSENFIDPIWAEAFSWLCVKLDECTSIDEAENQGVNWVELLDHLSNTFQYEELDIRVKVVNAMNLPADDVFRFVDAVVMARQLRKMDRQRQLQAMCRQVSQSSSTTDIDSYEIANVLRGTLNQLEGEVEKETMMSSKDAVSSTMKIIESRSKLCASGEAVGISTGLRYLDTILLGGWKNNNLVVFAGRPGQGKSAIALHMARRAAELGKHVCIYSLEMTPEEVMNRFICQCTSTSRENVQSGRLEPYEWAAVEQAGEYIGQLPIHISSETDRTMAEIRAESRKLRAIGRCDMIIIDYLQLVSSDSSRKVQTREREVAEMSRMAKLLAKELNIPILLLAQLNREVESRVSGTNEERCPAPTLSDLRESGAIEQDADIVIFIDRPETYGKVSVKVKGLNNGAPIDTKGLVRLTIAKNREGRTGEMVFMQSEGMNTISDFGSVPGPVLAQAKPVVVVDPNKNFETDRGEDLPF